MNVRNQKKKEKFNNKMIKLEIKHYLNQLNIFIIVKDYLMLMVQRRIITKEIN